MAILRSRDVTARSSIATSTRSESDLREKLEAVALRIQELAGWDKSVALIIDGGSGPPERPPVHLQAAAGGYLRLVGPEGPVLWGLVDSGWYGVEIVRATNSAIQALPPIRADEAELSHGDSGSPEFLGWWTRHFASQLCASSSTPLAHGRRYLFSPTASAAAAIPGMSAEQLVLRAERLDELLEQREDFELRWDNGYDGLLLTRQLSDASDGRVKMWRKRARDGRLPPLVTWWCRGLYTHVLLDGHDRVHAALLEGVKPDVLVLADATAASRDEVEERKRNVVDLAATLDTIPSVTSRASAVNTILRAGWDPRAEWKLATPGFPLDGGEDRWEEEVRGTSLASALSERRAAAERVSAEP